MNSEFVCKICKEPFNSYDSLRRHTVRIHKISSYQFYVDAQLNGIWPTCKCGCGEKVEWSRQLKGFRDYKAGHQSRICNNWGHNISAQIKSAETRRQQFANGERRVWNDGLTKEVDERVKINGEKSSKGILSNPDEIKRRSELMSKNRLNGIIPTLHGPKSSQWKGGVSEIKDIAHNSKKLYEQWKYPILLRDGFKCIECGVSNGKLHIHHDKERMSEIVKKHMPDIDEIKDFKLKKSIAEKVVDYHIQNKVSGITLCGKCHEKYHPSLNFD